MGFLFSNSWENQEDLHQFLQLQARVLDCNISNTEVYARGKVGEHFKAFFCIIDRVQHTIFFAIFVSTQRHYPIRLESQVL